MKDFLYKLSLIKRLNDHIEIGVGKQDQALVKELFQHFPDYIYQGLAFRAINCQWQEGFSNLSWSKSKAAAMSAHATHTYGSPLVYCADVQGFDVHRFVLELAESTNLLSNPSIKLMENEEEVLVVEYSSPREVTH